MSDYRGHVAAGAAFYAVLAFLLVVAVPATMGLDSHLLIDKWWEVPAQLLVAVLAALWPDVDITSQGRKLFYRLFLVLDLYLIFSGEWQAATFLGLFAILPGLGKHRGWTHRLWAALLVPAPIIIVPLFIESGWRLARVPDYSNFGQGLPYYLAAVVGYVSHLAADGMLGRGVGAVMNAALWPVRMLWKVAEKDHERLR
jgi:membrane-bound metal-dependent hydrolase YbcI (DUF457 family)